MQRTGACWTRWVLSALSLACLVTLPVALGQESKSLPPRLKAPFGPQQARRAQKDWAEHLDTPVVKTNSIGMKLVLIPPGEFQMGSPKDDVERDNDELQHLVRITRPFYLGAYEVTQAEFQQVMGRNPSWFSSTGIGKDEVSGLDTSRFPVDMVSWYDAAEFCNRLSQREDLKPYYRLQQIKRDEDGSIASAQVTVLGGPGYRLPTEAQWEYACRAGTTTPFYMDSCTGSQANVDGRLECVTANPIFLRRTTQVGKYPPNAFGLYDMHGNVWEWCEDWYDAKFYFHSPLEDPVNRRKSNGHVLRGGSWYDPPRNVRSASRDERKPSDQSVGVGFRVARAVE